MLTKPEAIMLVLLWELSHQLSYEEKDTAAGKKRKERRKADSLMAGPHQYPWGNRGCLESVRPQRKGNGRKFKEETN